MKKPIKYYTVVIEGIDKTGKDQLARYIDEVCGHWMCLPRRGVVSNKAYAVLYGREVPSYDLESESNNVYVFLRCTDKLDWKMRCKLTNEQAINYEENVRVMEGAWAEFKLCRDRKLCLEYDTSEMTPIQIARSVVDYMVKLNKDETR